ncbi:MAG TPA: hypothetical protein VMB80_05575 [Candidatus Acidoferrum sp.]|nr:hypothetical protein [Candidatus Acidoferrum sp.]
MNWLDTQTKELLQKVPDEPLAPSKTAEFALILLRKGQDRQRLVNAIIEINKCSKPTATILVEKSTPVTINPDLTEDEAIWGQFELICCDAISVFLRSEVVAQNDQSYLWPLFKRVLESREFKPATVSITEVPNTESGRQFVSQFLAGSQTMPVTLSVPFKKARIMEHWAARVGVQLRLDSIPSE